MDPLQENFERSIGDLFIEWFNESTATEFKYAGRADRAPDLVYSSGVSEIQVEVTAAYYDNEHAAFLWNGIRRPLELSPGWIGESPHRKLAEAVSNRIAEKSFNRYGANTVLLVDIPPGVTSAEELTSLLMEKPLPSSVPFLGIYVVGRFPITSRSTGGYRVIPILKAELDRVR